MCFLDLSSWFSASGGRSKLHVAITCAKRNPSRSTPRLPIRVIVSVGWMCHWKVFIHIILFIVSYINCIIYCIYFFIFTFGKKIFGSCGNFANFMAGNFLGGNFLGETFCPMLSFLEILWPGTFWAETVFGGYHKLYIRYKCLGDIKWNIHIKKK